MWITPALSTHTRTHTHLTALCPGLPGWAGTRKVKPIWILLKQEIVSGSGISWTICKSASWSRQISMQASHRSVFYRPDALLPPNQQRQSTQGIHIHTYSVHINQSPPRTLTTTGNYFQERLQDFGSGGQCPLATWGKENFEIWLRNGAISEVYLNKYVVSIAPFSTPACPDCSQITAVIFIAQT